MAFGQKADVITGEILEDGRIKTTTDAISAPNHSNAEAFYRYLATLCGGEVKKAPRAHGHVHSHEHAHDHEHAHS